MKWYLIKIKSYLPYPIENEYRIQASDFGTAINRAVRQFRKDLNKRKKITKLVIEAIKI